MFLPKKKIKLFKIHTQPHNGCTNVKKLKPWKMYINVAPLTVSSMEILTSP